MHAQQNRHSQERQPLTFRHARGAAESAGTFKTGASRRVCQLRRVSAARLPNSARFGRASRADATADTPSCTPAAMRRGAAPRRPPTTNHRARTLRTPTTTPTARTPPTRPTLTPSLPRTRPPFPTRRAAQRPPCLGNPYARPRPPPDSHGASPPRTTLTLWFSLLSLRGLARPLSPSLPLLPPPVLPRHRVVHRRPAPRERLLRKFRAPLLLRRNPRALRPRHPETDGPLCSPPRPLSLPSTPRSWASTARRGRARRSTRCCPRRR